MKTQRDIGTARVVKFCNGLHKTLSPIGHEADDDGWDGALVDIPVNTIVKLSIEEEVEEAEPKRILIVPEGVTYCTFEQSGLERYIALCHGSKVIAHISPYHDSTWRIETKTRKQSYTIPAKILAHGTDREALVPLSGIELREKIEHWLADIGEDGFGWKTEEPDLSRYVKFSVWTYWNGGYRNQDYPKYQEAIDGGNYFLKDYRIKTVFIHGWNANGQVKLLKTLTKGEVKNG